MGKKMQSVMMDDSLFSAFKDIGWITGEQDVNILTETGEKALRKMIPEKEAIDFQELHKKLRTRLKQITGAENKVLHTDKYFIPAVSVLKKRLTDASRLYKFKLDEKVEKVLLKHVTNAARTRFMEKPRLVMYFILGQNSKDSDLATALENFRDDGEEKALAVKSIETYI